MSLANAFKQLGLPNNAKPRASSSTTKQALKVLLTNTRVTPPNAANAENQNPNEEEERANKCIEEELKRLREDPYLALDLPCNATPSDIKKSYRKLSLSYHPDKTSAAISPIFQVLNQAYNTLTDPELKRIYDSARPAAPTDNFIPKARRRRSRPTFNSSNSSKPAPPTSAHHTGADQPSFIDDGRNSKITLVTFSPSLTQIGSNSFINATSLTSVTLPSTLKHVKSSAFKGCVNLTTVNLSNRLETLGPYTFNGCRSIRSMNLPSTLTTIGAYCFSYCKQLRDINIPESVVEFGSNAFGFCNELGLDSKIPLSDTAQVIEALRMKE
ncbi:hypothetical protein TL16_g06253 [Triparma laevis f. inornata]|uniref:J domain-containing protein n=2 Tax=Triparma laevis TaxID=1534972 RepID=A0A9W7FIR1_9STRA|nr:hypothetical protein TL16_g06253 [Triparma laevis f. inornata]GMI13194.1 hypothetical protein TrLO_g9215 [Triparma laevis f. longispina]